MVEQVIRILILFAISISLRILLVLNDQNWIRTKSHTSTLTILPLITYVITSVISGNIALSLGMVGALSIVRFRNPVRSPLELTVYFAAISLGISAAVSYKWLLFLGFGIYLFTILLGLISLINKKLFKKEFFIASFSEGNSLSTLEIEVSEDIKLVEESRFLKSISYSNNDNKKYFLATSDFESLKSFILNLDNKEKIINYQLNES